MSTTVNRRAVAKGVAWTVPAVTIAYAAPAVAASPQDVTVTKSGTGPITDGVLPFSICAIGADIASGSTFILGGVTGATVDSPFSVSG